MATENKGGIVRVSKRDSSYAIIDPYFLSDERLSWKAKGLLGYLLSKPSNWRVYVSDLVKRSKDGKDAVYSALRELEAAGYIERRQLRDPETQRITGYETVVFERPVERIEPDSPEPDAASPYTENPDAENPTQVINDLNNTDLKNECMNDARDPDGIMSALHRRLSAIPLNDTHAVGDFYFADIYAALLRHFPGRLDPEVIDLAAEQYVMMAVDMRTGLPRIDVMNPVGLFVDAYKTALAQYKALRYKRKRAAVRNIPPSFRPFTAKLAALIASEYQR
ncbi:helix-turn-helix domain-containing protein [Paenibacillus sp. p3-SID1389]|uniref:helix-turn-helix domain-containing protein n=1 Tax=Paenibacillus sp. p3-SID1389 TaxID=2916364 RepID=UPI0021A96A69|nr:helix-turn-helix domain-containing protein [Paenibacillus sp. p3-SID1389]MCT2195388.1 helix-turn-helix domain-containing protein [Paenibacillus sp. p3-SID1389]